MNTMMFKEPIKVAQLTPENQVKPLNQNVANDDVAVIILLNKNLNIMASRTPYDLDMNGKKMWEWVALSCNECEIKTTACTPESDILTLIKPYLTNKKWTFVLFSDTPLFSKNAFNTIMEYARAKQVNVLTLKRGYVFDTEYIKNAQSLFGGLVTEIGTKNDFFVVDSDQKFYEAKEILQKNILNFHIQNGIIIDNKNNTHIDADVVIESKTHIHQNNSIYGHTYIGKNCVLEPNNIIRDSIISDNCVIKNSFIEQSRISENMVVGPFESVINKSN